jgi:hypothetical protein
MIMEREKLKETKHSQCCGVFGTLWQAQIHAKNRGKTTPFASREGENKLRSEKQF